MLFNSFQFLIFFPLVTIIYFLLPHRWQWFHLLIASCIFYAAFIPAYLLILFATIITDYLAGIFIENTKGTRRKYFLILSIVANVGILAVFKYYDFFIDNINQLLIGLNFAIEPLGYLEIILPIGLSFHTFQAMSYTIEVYRGKQKAEKHFGIYALYVMFYPQLVAGPIERPQNLLRQFHVPRKTDPERIFSGFTQMLWGFFKKIVVADNCAVFVNQIWADHTQLSGPVLIIGAILFSFQIYCDFSGYSDIALGSARIMGFELMTNFRYPYFSRNIREFWKRWHISLSTWFRDYVYIPLGGSRMGRSRAIRNVVIIFILSGFWHGANWTFIIWGLLHGMFFLPFFLGKNSTDDNLNVTLHPKNLLKIARTFSLVTLAWIFFRSASLKESLEFIGGFGRWGDPLDFFMESNVYFITTVIILLGITQLFIMEWFNRTRDSVKIKRDWICVTLILEIVFLGSYKNPMNFIYFQF